MSTARAYSILVGVTLLVVLVAGFLPRLPLGSPAMVSTPTVPAALGTPDPANKVGLHTRLTDEPDPDKIRREFRMLREMGGTWAAEFFPWAYIQPSDRNRYDWAHADLVVDAAQEAGVRLIARTDGVPQWARPDKTTWKYLDEAHYADYAEFVAQFVARYRGRVAAYVVWNEPNTAAEWGQRKPDPAAYTALLKQVYTRAKAADPSANILLAGMAPNLEGEGSSLALNDLVYIDRLYDAGAQPYFDGVAVHAYGLKASPDDPSGPSTLNFARAEQVHNVLLRRGDGAKPTYITEGGWNDSPRWSYAVKPYQRVEYTVRAYQKATQEWPWCRGVMLWASRLPSPAYTYFDNYTFLTSDFIPKPVYLEVQKVFAPAGARP